MDGEKFMTNPRLLWIGELTRCSRSGYPSAVFFSKPNIKDRMPIMKKFAINPELKRGTVRKSVNRLLAVGAIATLSPVLRAEGLETESQKASYILGRSMIQQLKASEAELDFKAVTQGVEDEIAAKPAKFEPEETQTIMQSFEAKVRKKQEAAREMKEKARMEKGEKNLKEGKEFLAANAKKEGVKTTASGLQYKVLAEGSGEAPSKDDNVKVNYEGSLIDGEVFDSSFKRGMPATFGVGQVIKGWTEALTMMKPGAKWELYIPADLAYGDKGTPGGPIPPNAVLVFKVDLLEVLKKPAAGASAAHLAE